jgi:hypothetical protein
MRFIAAPYIFEYRVLDWNAKIIRIVLCYHAQTAKLSQFFHVPIDQLMKKLASFQKNAISSHDSGLGAA